MGGFGNRLFEPIDFIGEFPIDAHAVAFRQEISGSGVLFFGYFLLAKQKKVSH